ncbi:MAG: rhodanese-like domain-containing protein [Defluviitaleaceae bacterium]|nr:rhodanese-like domain-containing protein [Defluviitaleaceae bacterium]
MNRFKRITAFEAYEKMQSVPDVIILDVRTAEEFAAGKIPGALLLPDYLVNQRAEKILPNKDAEILVYCHSGIRSREAAYELASLGYTNVWDFGGINAWPYERV